MPWKRLACQIIVAVLTLYSCAAIAAAKPVLSMRDAIFLSLRYNPTIQNADIQRIVDKYNLRVAQFAFEIQYALQGSYTYNQTVSNGAKSGSDVLSVAHTTNLTGPYGTLFQTTISNPVTHTAGQSRFYNPVANVTITQPLLRGFGPDITLASLYNAEDQEFMNRLTLKNTAITTITSVINQYITTVQAEATVKAQIASLKQVQAAFEEAKLLVRAGQRGSADLVQFESNAAAQQLTLEQNQVTYEQAKANLLVLIGLEPTTQINVSSTVTDIFKYLPPLNENIRIALMNNPAYQQGLINLRVLKRQVAVAEDNIRPQLNLSLSRSQGSGTGGMPNAGPESLVNSNNYGTTAALTFAIPISTLPQEQAIASAKVGLRQAIITQAALKRQVEITVKTAYDTLLSQKKQVAQALQAVEFARKSYDIANIKLKYGKISAFEVNSLQTQLTTAQINYLITYASYITTQANFDSVLGITTDRWNLRIRY